MAMTNRETYRSKYFMKILKRTKYFFYLQILVKSVSFKKAVEILGT